MLGRTHFVGQSAGPLQTSANRTLPQRPTFTWGYSVRSPPVTETSNARFLVLKWVQAPELGCKPAAVGTDLLAACTSCGCQLQVPAVVYRPGAALHPLQHQKSGITTFYHTTTNLPPPYARTHLRTLRTACAAIVLNT